MEKGFKANRGQRINFFKTLCILYFLFMPTGVLAAFSGADLTGTWIGHELITGLNEGWETSTMNIAANGSFTFSWTDWAGYSGNANDTMMISPEGIISVAGKPFIRGSMSSDKNLMVVTDTREPGEYSIMLLVKSGGTFSMTDMAGNWTGHAILTGAGETWERASLRVTSAGLSRYSYGDGFGNSGSHSARLSISPSGIVRENNYLSTHGVMSSDKTIVVVTNSRGSGNVQKGTHSGDWGAVDARSNEYE